MLWFNVIEFFSRRIYMKIEFSSQRREMLLFLITNMAAVTSRANQQLTHWLIDWWMDLSIDWLNDWLIDWLTDWLIDWLTDWPTDWLIDWLMDWLMDGWIDWLIGRIICFSSWSTLEAVILCSIYSQSANLTNHDPGTWLHWFRWNDDAHEPLGSLTV